MKQIYKWIQPSNRNILILFIISCFLGGSSVSAQTGIFTIDGDLSLSISTMTMIELADLSGPGPGHDQVAVTGDVAIDGTLILSLAGYTPSPIDYFEIMNVTGSQSGSFLSVAWPTGMEDWSVDYGIIKPGKVTIYGPSATLPVALISFSVTAHEDYNLLSWMTASEMNNDYFEVEHSLDGINFISKEKIRGAGYSSEIMNYSYKEPNPEPGNNYYRLKQVDYNGQYTYSEIKSVSRNNDNDKLRMFPNPTNGIIHFSSPVRKAVIRDYTGRVVLKTDEKTDYLDLSHLTPGLYYISTDASAIQYPINITK